MTGDTASMMGRRSIKSGRKQGGTEEGKEEKRRRLLTRKHAPARQPKKEDKCLKEKGK